TQRTVYQIAKSQKLRAKHINQGFFDPSSSITVCSLDIHNKYMSLAHTSMTYESEDSSLMMGVQTNIIPSPKPSVFCRKIYVRFLLSDIGVGTKKAPKRSFRGVFDRRSCKGKVEGSKNPLVLKPAL
ncbi:hypothetical protein, partial [Gluconobacter sphaericus]